MTAWLLFIGFWLLLALLAAIEQLRPLHRDPVEREGRLLANFGLGAINFLLALPRPLSVVAAAQWAAEMRLGLFNRIDAPVAAAIATVLAFSLLQYGLHRAAHRVPLLWRLHRVHHCDTAVDLSTGLRNHPGEALVIACAAGGLALLLGASVVALIAYEAVAFAFALFTHANLRLPREADRRFRLILVTPAMHHVHHSARRDQTDSNYGDVLSLWDRLFGTCNPLPEEVLREVRFGLGDAFDPHAANLARQLGSPFERRSAGGASEA